MMFRTSAVRAAALAALLPALLLAAACAPAGGEKSAPANANSAANAANSNAAAANANGSAAAATNANASPAAPAGRAKLNLNTATEEQFMAAIPGFGKRMAHEFEEYRPYRSIQQFRREIAKYVSAEQVAEYEKYVFVPVDENESDAETLRQIPGLDAAEAAELVSGRPFKSREDFLSKLSPRVSADELAVARTYLVNR